MSEETTTTTAPEAVTTTEATDVPKAKVKKSKKNKRNVPSGQMHIHATFNNTIISFTDNSGGILTQSSAGACGFRGSKKGTAYAAQIAAEKAGTAAKQQYSLAKVNVFIKGIGQGREASVRALSNLGISVESIKDVTSIAHGGTRPRKARRN